MNIFTINSGHTGKSNDCKEKRKVYSIKEGLRMLDKVFGIVVTVRTDKSLNTHNSCFLPSFYLYKIFWFWKREAAERIKLEIQILPFHWLLKKAFACLKGCAAFPTSTFPSLYSVLCTSYLSALFWHPLPTSSSLSHSFPSSSQGRRAPKVFQKVQLQTLQKASIHPFWFTDLLFWILLFLLAGWVWRELKSAFQTEMRCSGKVYEEETGGNASIGDKNISFSQCFFLWRSPSWLGYKDTDNASFNRNKVGKNKMHI